LAFKDIPAQLLRETSLLDAEIVIGSFGSSTPYKGKAFQLKIEVDPNTPLPAQEEQLRYGKQPEIHHIFRSDPESPNKLITMIFTAGVLAALPILLGSWLALGGNVNHLGKALGAAPISHALFVGSVLAMEGVFFLYYTSWNLFQVLPVAGVVVVVAFYSGSKALSEVQERRLAGLR
jgi:oligosaccharyltransferase complex subunit delta (ribophorin II)